MGVVSFSLVTARRHALDAAQFGEPQPDGRLPRGGRPDSGRGSSRNHLIAQKIRSEQAAVSTFTPGAGTTCWFCRGWRRLHSLVLMEWSNRRRSLAIPAATDLSDRAHFRVHLDGRFRGLFIGQSIVSRAFWPPGLPVSRPIEAEDGTFLGVLIVLLSRQHADDAPQIDRSGAARRDDAERGSTTDSRPLQRG